jgi:hypothetical protein
MCIGLGLQCILGMLLRHLQACQFHNSEEVETAIHEWVQMAQPDFCCDRNFQLVPVENLSLNQ